MQDRLCSRLNDKCGSDLVNEVVLSARMEAQARGFGLGMVRRSLSHIETETISQDKETAKVKLCASSRVCIHPAFTWVATLFNLGEVKEVEAVLTLVKEGGCWKVCGNPFGMAVSKV